jgi:tRNA-splicing ligase RtcB
MNVWKNDGYYVPVKSWCPDAEPGTITQIGNAASLPFAFHHAALMPDAHVGYGAPIGGILATKGVAICNFVGLDIGCGMNSVQTSLTEISTEDIKTIMGQVRSVIPVGFNHNKQAADVSFMPTLPKDIQGRSIVEQQYESARHQLGTLGGGVCLPSIAI